MKRFPLFGLIIALASCGGALDSNDQEVACYDTGHGMKCVPIDQLPSNTTAICIDKDGDAGASQSSASGPSPSDNDTSESSDAPTGLPAGGDAGDGDGDDGDDGDDSSAEDASGASDSSAPNCGGGAADTDGDGVSDSKDCDCVNPDNPPGTPTGGGPILQ